MYALEKIVSKLNLPPDLKTVTPPPEVDADLAIPCFKHDPNELAQKIISLRNPYIEKVEVMNRYVNLKLNEQYLSKEVLAEVLKRGDKYGFHSSIGSRNKKRPKVLIEYSSPNIAKPLHIGHLRNTVLGRSLKKIYEANGYKVITENFLGDWGKQYGLLMLAFEKRGDEKELAKKRTEYLLKLYNQAVQLGKKSKKFDDEAKEIFKRLELGDRRLLKLWKKFRDISISDFKKTYKKLGVDFDLWTGESFYVKKMPAVIERALKKKIAQKDGEAVAVDLERYGLRSYLLVKSDGASLYNARDLAAQSYRADKYKPEKIMILTAHEQEFYFRQLIKTLELMGYPRGKFENVVYGVVTLAGKKMSTRAGNIVTLENILEEAIRKAKGSEIIGKGAIIYNLLAQSNKKSVAFDWQRALSLQGSSAPYIQYGYVRAKGVLRKAKIFNLQFLFLRDISRSETIYNLGKIEEELVMSLARFPEIIKQAKDHNEPHLIATYLNGLVQDFNRFYEEKPILKAEKDVMNFRLALTAAVGQVIKNGLGLLGIEAPNKM